MKEYLRPVSKAVCAHREVLSDGVLGKQISIFQQEDKFPEVSNFKFALLGVPEHRRDEDFMGETIEFDSVRMAFYGLYPGNWQWSMVDLGDIIPGNSIGDTDFAVREVVHQLLLLGVMPIVLGGSQDLLYAHYRAFDGVHDMISLVNVDHRFDLGDHQKPLTNKAYVGKMVVDSPYNLMNYSVLGYQSYLNPPEEIALMDKLHFDAYRLGEVSHTISIAEPVFRDADLVTFDLTSVKSADSGNIITFVPNGFDGKEICSLARYAGISDKVKCFGLFNHNGTVQESMLIAQVIWYFIEGFNFRTAENPLVNSNNYMRYIVPVDTIELIFIKSIKTERWWIEIPFSTTVNNKVKRITLLPCSHDDYLRACDQELPERWWKAQRKTVL